MSHDIDTVPRHLRVAMANAQRAFERDDIAALSTINEDIQGLIDAAVAWGRRGAAGVASDRRVLLAFRVRQRPGVQP